MPGGSCRSGAGLDVGGSVAARFGGFRRLVLLFALLAAVSSTVGGVLGRFGSTQPPRAPGGVPNLAAAVPQVATQPAASSPAGSAGPQVVPSGGTGTFAYAPTGSGVHGSAGQVRRYKVAVENGSGQDAAAFASAVETILGDPRSWIAGGNLRVQRVAPDAAAEFTIFLATPLTSQSMCAKGGLQTRAYTSCRLTGKVIINLARWLTIIPDYNAPVAEYQAYVINHEVGHEFGNGHELCPGAGRPAPVMQQQTFGLKGCIANGWPFVDGKRYRGPATS